MSSCQKLQAHVRAPLLADSPLLTYQVTDRVVLAGQPEPDDWARLARHGVALIINVRSDPQRAAAQAQSAAAAGLAYVHLNVPAYELETEHVAAFEQALQQADAGTIVVHCRTASRVALLWLLRRMLHDGWSQTAAEAELAAAGYQDDDMEVFRFCTEDFLERAEMPETP